MKDLKNRNIVFKYLYRDAGNFKLFHEIVFANPDGLALDTVEKCIRKSLVENLYFDPEQWGVEKLQFPEWNPALDHDWCEYVEVCFTDELAASGFCVGVFLERIRGCSN